MFTPRSIRGQKHARKNINYVNGQPTKKEYKCMKVKGIIFEDIVNYKKISMTIMMPYCDFKCDKECGNKVCQNSHLANTESINVDIKSIIARYLDNDITSAIVCQGLEPFDSWDDLYELVKEFVSSCDDDIVIYTGYAESEIKDKVDILKDLVKNKNTCIIKYGRFIPDQEHHIDKILGVELSSPNQYGIVINPTE